MCKCDKISLLRSRFLECIKILEDFEGRMLKMEADLDAINKWIDRNDDANERDIKKHSTENTLDI